MESVSQTINKKCLKRIAHFVLFLILFVLFSSGCDTYANTYPFLQHATWICENPSFSLDYSVDYADDSKETIDLQGSITDVDVLYNADYFCVYPDGNNYHDSRLLSGTWCYRDGCLVFQIEEDFIFHNQFSEVIFTKQHSPK